MFEAGCFRVGGNRLKSMLNDHYVKVKYDQIGTCNKLMQLLGGAVTCSEGFVMYFLKVPLACLGSMAVAVKPNGLGKSQKIGYKTFKKSGRPTRYSLGRQLDPMVL